MVVPSRELKMRTSNLHQGENYCLLELLVGVDDQNYVVGIFRVSFYLRMRRRFDLYDSYR